MKIIEKILRVAIATGLGVIFNKIFSSTNEIVGDLETFEHNIPFIYTVGLLEITTFILGTTILALIVYIAYHKSRSSQKEIYKIYSFILETEVLIGSFIVGTQIFGTEKIFMLEQLVLILLIFIGIMFFYSIIYEKDEKSKKEISSEKKLYESRNPLLRIMDDYLQSMSSFSIIGEWGIGKTNLIDNFFYGEEVDSNGKKYKEKYEMLYIDASIYSNNQKIVETIESELNNLFKSAGILKRTTSFIDELFAQNNSFLMGVYQYIFSSGTVDEERKKIENRIAEIKNNDKKLVVLCLDNLERLNSKERVVELFAIVNETLPKNVKKIYTYEEKEMVKIFEKEDSSDFVEYMEKYTFNKIEVRDVTIEEILKDNPLAKEYIEKIVSRCDDEVLKSKIENDVKRTISTGVYSDINDYMDNLKLDFTQKLESIKLKLNNPRYVENILTYLKSSENRGEEYKYKLEYKITRDLLRTITMNDLKIKEVERIEIFDDVRALRLRNTNRTPISIAKDRVELDKLEQLCLYLLFKMSDDGDLSDDINKKINYFEVFFENKGELDKAEEYEKLRKLKQTPKENLLKILDKISFIDNDKYIEKVKEYLRAQEDLKFVIDNSSQMRDLIFLEELEEFWDELFQCLVRSDKLSDSEFKIITDYYLLSNKYIKDFIQLIAGDLEDYLNKNFEEIEIFLAEIPSIQNVEGLIIRLESELEIKTEDLINLKIYEKLYKILKVAKEMRSIEFIPSESSNEFLKVDSEIFKLSRKDILYMLNGDGEEFKIDARYYSQIIEIPKERVNEYIGLLQEDLENPKLADGVRVLIIELMKFRDRDEEN